MADDLATTTPAATKTAAADPKTGLTDAIRTAFTGDAPLLDKAKALYKARPVATVALAGVVGIALLNTLRGKR